MDLDDIQFEFYVRDRSQNVLDELQIRDGTDCRIAVVERKTIDMVGRVTTSERVTRVVLFKRDQRRSKSDTFCHDAMSLDSDRSKNP